MLSDSLKKSNSSLQSESEHGPSNILLHISAPLDIFQHTTSPDLEPEKRKSPEALTKEHSPSTSLTREE
jgi:hypothetical protein